MTNRTLAEEIITLIQSEANNNPPPKACKIIGNYGDSPYSDVEVEDLGILTYKKTIGDTKIGLDGIICFLNGDLDKGVVLTPGINNQNGSSDNVDLSDYIRKSDVSLDMDTMNNGYLNIKLDIGDGF